MAQVSGQDVFTASRIDETSQRGVWLVMVSGVGLLVSAVLYLLVLLAALSSDGEPEWPLWALAALGPIHLACWITCYQAVTAAAYKYRWLVRTLVLAVLWVLAGGWISAAVGFEIVQDQISPID